MFDILAPLIHFSVWCLFLFINLHRQRRDYEKIIAGMQKDIARRELELDLKMREFDERRKREEGDN